MELNKYDLVEFLVSHLRTMSCVDCPIQKECGEREKRTGESFICRNKDKIRETLIKKYNL